MPAVAKRFVELGVAPRLAVELTTQINSGVGNKRRLVELGVISVAASIIVAGISAGSLNRSRLVESGIIPRVAKEIAASLGGGELRLNGALLTLNGRGLFLRNGTLLIGSA